MTNLAIRIITALVFGTLFLLCLFLSPYSLAFIFLLICFFASKEYYSIHAKILDSAEEPIWYLTIFNSCFYLFFILGLLLNEWFVLGSLVSFLLPLFMRKKISTIKFWRGILYISIPCIIANVILNNSLGIQWLFIAVIIGIFGPIGDLIESRIKRKANIKDSGKILPGHGGILDRMDAFFFSVLFVFIYLYFLV